MAVASPRSAFRFWIAWVAAAAVGTALAAAATSPAAAYGSVVDVGRWISAPLLALPVALLQFVVLRALLRVSPGTAGLWVVLTLIAAVAQGPALIAWYLGVIPIFGGSSTLTAEGVVWSVDPRWADFALDSSQYIAPALLGIAQGIALVRVFGHPGVVAIWLFTNLLAFIGAIQLATLALGGAWFQVDDYVVRVTVYGTIYGAITGAVLVAMSARAAARAPVPAARLPQAPTP